MVNWYYVVGSDRVGPVSVQALQVLFSNGEINLHTYVWKKGFVNWERIENVAELSFNSQLKEKDISSGKIEEERISPAVKFSFDWNTVSKNEELFFIKIGKDRGQSAAEIYGPYTMIELKEALEERRINLHTLLYAAGMNCWTKLQDTPINSDYIGISLSSISLSEIPLVLIFESSPMPLVSIVKKAGDKGAVLLGAGGFEGFKNKIVKASLYAGSEIKAKNVKIRVQNYDKKNQAIECNFVDLELDAKKLILNHAV